MLFVVAPPLFLTISGGGESTKTYYLTGGRMAIEVRSSQACGFRTHLENPNQPPIDLLSAFIARLGTIFSQLQSRFGSIRTLPLIFAWDTDAGFPALTNTAKSQAGPVRICRLTYAMPCL